MKRPAKKNRARLVRCRVHGEMEGYVACRCVADGVKPTAKVEHPGESHPTLGLILCADCAAAKSDDLVLLCGFCARDKGVNRIGGKRVD
jgi:hypothetical protein